MAGTYVRQVVDTGCIVYDRATSTQEILALPNQTVEVLERPAVATQDWQLVRLYDDDETEYQEVWIREKFLAPANLVIIVDDFATQCIAAAQAFGANHDYLLALALYLTGCTNVAERPSSACGPFLFLRQVWSDTLPGAADFEITAVDRYIPTLQPYGAAAVAARAMAAFRAPEGANRLPTAAELAFVHLFGLGSLDVLLRHVAAPAALDPSMDMVIDAFCGNQLQGHVPKTVLLADLAATGLDLLATNGRTATVGEVLAKIAAGLVAPLASATATFARIIVAPPLVAPAVPVPVDVVSLPAEDPTPFARLDSAPEQAFWPLITADPQALLVSYRNRAGQSFGLAGRQFFADRSNGVRHHVGMDIFCKENDVVIAIAPGRIVAFFPFYTSQSGEMTFALLVEHAGVVVNYGEVKGAARTEFGWAIGDPVRAGQKLARVSATAMIHFETYRPGTDTTARWMRGDARPASLLNPTLMLLTLAAQGQRTGEGGAIAGAGQSAGHQPAVATPGTATDLLTLARTIYGEARGEVARGREAVAHVVQNRLASGRFQNDIAAVCRQPNQFSCWNRNDPNLPVIQSIQPGASKLFDQCLAAAEGVLQGQFADMTMGATHYYAKYIAPPSWIRESPHAQLTIEIGVHRFYRGIR